MSIDSIGNQNADLYISTRLMSQGSQETYSYNPEENEDNNELEVENEEVDEVEEELITSFNNKNNNRNILKSPYTTPRQAKLMRDISSTHQTLSDSE